MGNRYYRSKINEGDRFNNWTVIREVRPSKFSRMFLCVNNDGLEKEVSLFHLKSGASQGHFGKGKHNGNWKGGSLKFKKEIVKKEKNWTCEICGLYDKEITQVDHIIPKCRKGKDNYKNLMCICPNCHARKSLKEKRTK